MKRAAIVLVAAITIAALLFSLPAFADSAEKSTSDSMVNLFNPDECVLDSYLTYQIVNMQVTYGVVKPKPGYLVTGFIPITPDDPNIEGVDMGEVHIVGFDNPYPSEYPLESDYSYWFAVFYDANKQMLTNSGRASVFNAAVGSADHGGIAHYQNGVLSYKLGYLAQHKYLTSKDALNAGYDTGAGYYFDHVETIDDQADDSDIVFSQNAYYVRFVLKTPEDLSKCGIYIGSSELTFGAQSASDYSAFDPDNYIYLVDKQGWYMGDKPFYDQPDKLYQDYWTYIPCVAKYPVAYSTQILQCYTMIEDYTGIRGRQYFYSLRTERVTASNGRPISKMVLEQSFSDGDELNELIQRWTFTEGVDFVESCIFIGCCFEQGASSAEDFRVNFCFLIDGEFKYFSTDPVDYSYTYIYLGSRIQHEFYTMAFSTTPFTPQGFLNVYNRLFDSIQSSDNFASWNKAFYVGANDDVLDAIYDILGVLQQPSAVPAPTPQQPSQENQEALDSISNAHGGVGGTFNSYFDDASSGLNQLLDDALDTTDFLTLNSIFSWTMLRILELPNFVLIVHALVFLFVLWVLGLNFSAVFSKGSKSNDKSRNSKK